ncbi:MAG: proline dehydrogenase [Bacteroidetes bacterium]|nr:proline dehydrogenase family protein [Bacteroidia bacterium]MBN4052397.1 proline dehydrogenase family protein [Sphingobacteriaceae bacterium AH-315-L07]PCH69830.1 MAG: proline dehydrogenase [Bacteroidota bacterium]
MAETVSFDNTTIAFSDKSNLGLRQSYWMFKLMSNHGLVSFSQKAALLAINLGLPIHWIIKATIFKQFCGGESIEGCESTVKKLSKYNIGAILDYSVEGNNTDEAFDEALKEKLNSIRNAKSNKDVPFSVIKVTGIARFELLAKVSAKDELTTEEQNEFNKGLERLDQFCKLGFTFDVRVFIDAEESWIQDAIDGMALQMMERYNKEKPIVYNTLQMYRHDRLAYLKKSLEFCRERNLKLGIKIVRGAYMEQEKERAEQNGYDSPIQTSKENTDKDYDEAIEYCIKNIADIGLCAATHNEQSCYKLISLISENGLDKSNPDIYFGQLYGMSDQITFNLAYSGYNVAKYLPYGPIKKVLPYLIRRAQENTSIAGQMSRELSLIMAEKKRRAQ